MTAFFLFSWSVWLSLLVLSISIKVFDSINFFLSLLRFLIHWFLFIFFNSFLSSTYCGFTFLFQFLKVEAEVNDLSPFFMSNAGIRLYEFPSKHRLSFVPHVSIFWDFISVQLKMLSNFPFDFFLTHESFRNVFFSFQIFGDFSKYFMPLISNSIVVRETLGTVWIYWDLCYGTERGWSWLSSEWT